MQQPEEDFTALELRNPTPNLGTQVLAGGLSPGLPCSASFLSHRPIISSMLNPPAAPPLYSPTRGPPATLSGSSQSHPLCHIYCVRHRAEHFANCISFQLPWSTQSWTTIPLNR
jgi:hypothetical protein